MPWPHLSAAGFAGRTAARYNIPETILPMSPFLSFILGFVAGIIVLWKISQIVG